MQISAALRFPFRGPHIWPNIGSLLVCMLIPIVGPMVAMGFHIGVEKALIQNLDSDAPKFDFGKFSQYLQRGVWPFVASLLLMLIILPFHFLLMGGAFAGMLLTDHNPKLGVAILLTLGLLDIIMITFAGMLISPMVFKAGLQQSLAAAWDRTFLFDYWKRVGLLTVGMQLLMMLITIPIMIIGLCALYIGAWVAMVCIMLMQTHIRVQLYLEYLNRGGIPIPFIPDEPDGRAFPVQLTQTSPQPPTDVPPG